MIPDVCILIAPNTRRKWRMARYLVATGDVRWMSRPFCCTCAFVRRNPKITRLPVSTFLFSVICDRICLDQMSRFGALSEVSWRCGGCATEPETRRPFDELETIYYGCHHPASYCPRCGAAHYSLNPCQ